MATRSAAATLLLILTLLSSCGSRETDAPIPGDHYIYDEGPDNSVEVRARNAESISKCAKEFETSHQGKTCALGNFNPACFTDKAELSLSLQNATRYTVRHEDDGFHLGMILHFFTPETSNERAEEMVSAAKSCIPKIRNLWLRYGVQFDLEMDLNSTADLFFNQTKVTLIDGEGRSNWRTYYFRGFGEGLDTFCKTMLHEMGHLLGLYDEYAEYPETSPFPDERRPWSVMKNPHQTWDNLDFYPRHIKSIFEPVCKETFSRL